MFRSTVQLFIRPIGMVVVLFWSANAFAACGCGTSVPCAGSCESTIFGNVCTLCGAISEGGPCGATSGNAIRSCTAGTACSNPFGSGTCVGDQPAGANCLGIGQGNCADGLVCDVIGECRHAPPEQGEPCGTGVVCAGGLTCSSTVGGRCEAQRQAGDSCNLLIPNQCAGDLVCDAVQSVCRHDPAQVDEPCGPLVACADGLYCPGLFDQGQPFRCAVKASVGESCSSSDGCRDGLTCRYCGLENCEIKKACYPAADDEIWHRERCLELHSGAQHQKALDRQHALTYGGGFIGGPVSNEVGNVYGEDGRYGCYYTHCTGVPSGTAESFGFVSSGKYLSYADVNGDKRVIGRDMGPDLYLFGAPMPVPSRFSVAEIFDLYGGGEVGENWSMKLGIGLGPWIGQIYFDCTTIVDTVAGLATVGDVTSIAAIVNSPPVAVCASGLEQCADALTCRAPVDINAGSYDPDGESVTLRQSPVGPYALGRHVIRLDATDPDGASASCSAAVDISDCTPPELSCNAPVSLSPPQLPAAIRGSASDACDTALTAPVITGAHCSKITRNGRVVDVTDDCGLQVDGDRLWINDGAGVGTTIGWTIEATDASGNHSSRACTVEMVRPDRGATESD